MDTYPLLQQSLKTCGERCAEKSYAQMILQRLEPDMSGKCVSKKLRTSGVVYLPLSDVATDTHGPYPQLRMCSRNWSFRTSPAALKHKSAYGGPSVNNRSLLLNMVAADKS